MKGENQWRRVPEKSMELINVTATRTTRAASRARTITTFSWRTRKGKACQTPKRYVICFQWVALTRVCRNVAKDGQWRALFDSHRVLELERANLLLFPLRGAARLSFCSAGSSHHPCESSRAARRRSSCRAFPNS